MALDPARVVSRLRELQELTGDEDGAQRVAWTDTWARARSWLADSLSDLPLDLERDEAGNDWYTLRGESERAVLLGGHMDSVPERRLARRLSQRARRRRGAAEDRRRGNAACDGAARRLGRRRGGSVRPFPVRLVRGRRLDGRSDELRKLADRDGVLLTEALGAFGIDLDRALGLAPSARGRCRVPRAPHRAGACARVAGSPARRRARDVRCRAAPHHLARPGRTRRLDADGPAPRCARRCREARAPHPRDRRRGRRWRRLHVRRRGHADPASSRRSSRRPSNSSTSGISTRQRWRGCWSWPRTPPRGSPREENIEVEWERIWSIEPILFDETLVAFCDEAIREVTGTSHRLPSGPLHDAAEVSRSGVPTVMLFVQSLRGLSHTKLEDTRSEHLELAVAGARPPRHEDDRLAGDRRRRA